MNYARSWSEAFIASISRDPVKALALLVLFADMCFAATSGIITYDVVRGGSPITPDLYGARVHAITALVWSSVQEKAALMGMIGAMMIASHSRWSVIAGLMVLVGNLVLAGLMTTLAIMAYDAPQGIVMFAMCVACGVPWSLGCAFLAGLYLASGERKK